MTVTDFIASAASKDAPSAAPGPPVVPEDASSENTRSARQVVLACLAHTVGAGPQTVEQVRGATGINLQWIACTKRFPTSSTLAMYQA